PPVRSSVRKLPLTAVESSGIAPRPRFREGLWTRHSGTRGGRLEGYRALSGAPLHRARRHGDRLRGARSQAPAERGAEDGPALRRGVALPVQARVPDARGRDPPEPRSPPRARDGRGGAGLLRDGARARHGLLAARPPDRDGSPARRFGHPDLPAEPRASPLDADARPHAR